MHLFEDEENRWEVVEHRLQRDFPGVVQGAHAPSVQSRRRDVVDPVRRRFGSASLRARSRSVSVEVRVVLMCLIMERRSPRGLRRATRLRVRRHPTSPSRPPCPPPPPWTVGRTPRVRSDPLREAVPRAPDNRERIPGFERDEFVQVEEDVEGIAESLHRRKSRMVIVRSPPG